MLNTGVHIGGHREVSPTEVTSPLKETRGRYQVVKLFENQVLDTMEFTDNIREASGRIEYLNNRSWKAVYMVRKLS